MAETECKCKCETPNRKVISKKPITVEEEPGAYCGTITHTTFEIKCECKDCGEKWVETKVESKFE